MRFLCCLLLLGALPGLSEARRQVRAEQPLTVCLEPNYMAVLTFPEQIVRVIGAAHAQAAPTDGPPLPAASQPITIEFYSNVLALALMQPEAVGRFVAFGDSGQTYLVNYKACPRGDDQIDIVSQTRQEAVAPPFSAASFLRAVKTAQSVPGAMPEELPLPGQPDQRLRILHATATGLPQGLAWVVQVENTTGEPLEIDERIGLPAEPSPQVVALTQWTWLPGFAVALVHAEQRHLPPGGQTRLILILERRS